MAKEQELYVLVDETGVDVGYYATKKELQSNFSWWTKSGMEPSSRVQRYTPTRRGIAKLLNDLTVET